MKILGIDPGLNNLAYAILETNGNYCILKDWDTFNTQKIKDLPVKLSYLYLKLEEIIKTWAPDLIVIEEIFTKTYSFASAKLIHAQTIAFLLAGLHQIPIKTYHPNKVKKFFTQNGKAGKEEMSYSLNLLFQNQIIKKQTDKKEDNHKIDALALALIPVLENLI
ncbi:MAG: hypothetical protein DRP29_02120 [Thermodesulfobacteriota bacterium]|nr:MAG: hypothetical protein DRP29_02120 [Thermodesulfobacteriota bacterium]RLG12116.1 MAG: hypothetical protein DRN73_03480 [Candidatus Pacearchaeota archaeon]